MDISITASREHGVNLTVDESASEHYDGKRNTQEMTALLARVVVKVCKALDLNVYDVAGMIGRVSYAQQDHEAKLSMDAETWPLFVTSYDDDDDVMIVYCGDRECPLDAENSEIMRLDTELDDQGDSLGSVVTLKKLRDHIMGHILQVNARRVEPE
jgi:hypothetical protein